VLPAITGIPQRNNLSLRQNWTTEMDDELIKLRGQGNEWDEPAKHFHSQSAVPCCMRWRNYSDDVCCSEKQALDRDHGFSVRTSENGPGALTSAIVSVQNTTRPEPAVREAYTALETICLPDRCQEEALDELIRENVSK
jgi:hypothetical protein